MKVSKGHRRDFSAYLRWRREWGEDFLPESALPQERGNASALECFAEIESKGKSESPPRQPKLLSAVLLGKALLNFQIKQWSETCADAASLAWTVCLASIQELETDFPWLPAWVWVAVENAARKKSVHTGTITYQKWKAERIVSVGNLGK